MPAPHPRPPSGALHRWSAIHLSRNGLSFIPTISITTNRDLPILSGTIDTMKPGRIHLVSVQQELRTECADAQTWHPHANSNSGNIMNHPIQTGPTARPGQQRACWRPKTSTARTHCRTPAGPFIGNSSPAAAAPGAARDTRTPWHTPAQSCHRPHLNQDLQTRGIAHSCRA
jgi:hypothetical protein